MNNRGFANGARQSKSQRREWEAFQGLLFLLGSPQTTCGLVDAYRRIVGRWRADSISRWELKGEAKAQGLSGELDFALARLVREGVLARL